MTTVREINDAADLAALGPLWDELLEQTPGASFFHSRAWLEIFWTHFSAGKRLRVLVVYDEDRAIGIVPLVVRTVRRSEPIRVLTYPLDGWGYYYGPIGRDPVTTLVAALAHIRRTPRDWHILELPWIDAIADEGRTRLALDRSGFPTICETQFTSATIDLAAHGTWDAYLATRSPNCRKDLRRKEKRLAERGTVTYMRHRPTRTEGIQSDPRWDLYDACEAIARASWQGAARDGTMLSKDAFRAFYRDCHLAAARAGAIDLSLILVDGRPVAFQYASQYRGCVSSLKAAFDPQFDYEGAGTVIKARTIADSFARGDHTFDMGPQFLEIKRRWLTHLRPIHRYLHFPPGAVVGQLIRAKRALERRLKSSLRAWQVDAPAPASRADSAITIDRGG